MSETGLAVVATLLAAGGVAGLRVAWGASGRRRSAALGISAIAGPASLVGWCLSAGPMRGLALATGVMTLTAYGLVAANVSLAGRRRSHAAPVERPAFPAPATRAAKVVARWIAAGPLAGTIAFAIALAFTLWGPGSQDDRLLVAAYGAPVLWGIGMVLAAAARREGSSRIVRRMLAAHSVLGLAFGAVTYLVCLTGTVAVFVDELARWEQPGAPEMRSLAPGIVDRAVANALRAAGESRVDTVTLRLPGSDWPRLIVGVYGDGLETSWIADADGALVAEDHPTWSSFAGDLHMHLHVPGLWGYLLVGLVGVGVLGLAVSGVLSHPRIFKDAFFFRWGAWRRLQQTDLHNRLGVWGLPFNVAVSVTGSYLGLVSLLVLLVGAVAYGGHSEEVTKRFAPPETAAGPAAAALPSFEAALERVRSRAGGDRPFSLVVKRPRTKGQAIEIYSKVRHRMLYGELFSFDADGRPVAVGFAGPALGAQLYAGAYALHFGTFGGLPVKLLYLAFGLALSVVTVSGVSIWLARRRDQHRALAWAERVWAATVWGVPLALCASALGVLSRLGSPLPIFLGTLAIAYGAAAFARGGSGLARTLRLATGASLVAVAGTHVAVFHGTGLAPIPFAIDATLALSAAALIAPALIRRLR